MRQLPWKKIIIGIAAAGVFIAAFFYFNTGKSSKPVPDFVDPAFAEYITSYTAGTISSGSSLRIVFAKDAVDSTMIGQESSVKLFSFSPVLKGKAFWIDTRTVEFQPEKRLTSGQAYEVNFQLGKVIEVPDPFSVFTYAFHVLPQNFEVSIENVKPYVKTDLKRQKVEGLLLTADFAESTDIEKTLTANQEGNTLKVSWVHSGDGKQHNFIIEDVSRKDQASEVALTVRGDAVGVGRTLKETVTIPALGDFKLMNTKVVQNPSQYVVLQFSDPLKEKQNLNGLVKVADLESLDFEIHENEIWIYPPVRQVGTKTVYIEAGVRNVLDYKMKEPATAEVVFEQLKPAVRFTGKGSILPSTDGLVLPFEAVNLKSVDVTIMKIFEKNILQFLQVNSIDGNYEMHRVGKRVIKRTLTLDNTGVTDLGKWNRYTLDLSKLISTEPGAIYQVKLSFKKPYSSYSCDGETDESENMTSFGDEDEFSSYGEDEYYYEDDYYYYDYGDYDWEQRDNPCHGMYYRFNRHVTKNILASDLGLISKRGSDGTTTVFATDLKTTQPLSGVEVKLFSFQQQVIASAVTDAEGKAVITHQEPAFAMIASGGQQRGYLKLQDGEALSVSHFDVAGETIQRGLKGLLYGERGVWRPGDSLYLTFVLEDKNKLLPPSHPVVFELQNPQGQIVNRLVRTSAENGFYNFNTSTSADAPTGNWTGRVKVGGTEFTKTLKIETVKPNRLKINLDFGTERFTSPNVSGNLEVKWLHGAPARNLNAEFEVLLGKTETTFPKYESYVFEDPARNFYSESQSVFSGYTDDEGRATVNASLSSKGAPGFLTAIFRGKVFEESGNFSIDRFSIPYSPYPVYVGMKAPEGERYTGILYTDTTQTIDIVTLNADGKPVSRQNVEVGLYQLDKRWWWDYSTGSVANYIQGNYTKVISNDKINTTNGKGTWSFEVAAPDWGRYYVQVCDPASGHCTGKVIYMDEPGWYSRSRGGDNAGGATMLNITTDKTTYNLGEKINLTIPGSAQGRALVSVENGSKVLQTFWVETQQGPSKFSIDVTRDMAPNVFIHVSLLQQHAQTSNDLPVRLYGVVPVIVQDPETHLEPVINMAGELEPGKEVIIKISEKNNKKMTYTVAVVDEGLLDLTRFKTPDLWNRFYAREAHGVRTWDVYDQVIGAFGAQLERVLAIGGGVELEAKEDDARANRFKAVVKYFGPFTLSGGTATHSFVMPQYIGSVKTMVVAGYEGAYGKAEKATPVRKPLMVLATLPRVLGPEENVKLPVTLFTQQKDIRNVKVSVKASGPLKVTGSSSKSVSIGSNGDLTVDFDLGVQAATGVAKVEVTATSGSYSATDVIEIEIRNPNTPVTRVTDALLDAGKTWASEVIPFGIAGTNTAVLEVSNIPPINLGWRLRYLFNYPYGCLEQTTSSVFPQLYVENVKALTDNEKAAVQRNVTAGIERLKSFVQRDGGFGYWPGAENPDSWSTSYAGHFLVEAEAKGFFVPSEMMKRWKKYQKNKALEWRGNDKHYNSELIQAYRLYTLALSGSAELGAMNRLREMGGLSSTSAWMLAAAYAKAGQPEAARKMITSLSTTVKPYRECGYSYGSHYRDKALILETLVLLNDKVKAYDLLKEISSQLSSQEWMSTQETAFCLKAVSSFVALEKRGALKFSYTLNDGKTVQASTALPIAQVQIPISGTQKQSVKVVNESGGTLFTRVIMEGTPARGQEEDEQKDLTMTIRYVDMNGSEIDPTRLEQGTEFIAEVSVFHPGLHSQYQNLALSQVFPSGWEINNLRLEEAEGFVATDAFTYQDIRDDRVYTHFDIYPNTRKTFRVMLTASYAGTFYLPATSCGAMYDNSIYARKKGQIVEVVKPVTQ